MGTNKDKTDTPTHAGDSTLNRETLQRTKALLLSTLATETDAEAINLGIGRIADINASIKRLDDLSAARSEVNTLRRQYAEKQVTTADADRQLFLQNCNMITASAISSVCADDRELSNIRKQQAKYFGELTGMLSFEDANKQVDEICQADRERRDWLPVVNLPEVTPRKGSRVNSLGEPV